MNTSLVAALLNIVLTVILIPLFGLYAAAGATALAFLAMAVFRHYDVKKHVQITYEKGVFVVLGVLYTVILTLYYMDTLWASIVGLVIAVISAYLLNRHELGKMKGLVMVRLASRIH